jgi:hypothetical protein
MKKGILILVIFLAAGCRDKIKKFTILAEGTPYVVYPEILNGRIQTIEEKSYWAFPHRGRYIRGRSLTREERMNLGGWSDDYKAVFDSSATLQICEALQESGIPEWKNEFVKEKNLITRTNYFFHDTLVFYQLFKYGLKGNIISGKRYLAGLNSL